MDIQQRTQEVEKELLDIIVRHLEQNKIDSKTASKLAQDFLAVLPMRNQEDLLQKLKGLSTQYREAGEVYKYELAKEIRQKEEHAIDKIHGAIKQGNIDHALKIAHSLRTDS
jgi:hypothetical protein